GIACRRRHGGAADRAFRGRRCRARLLDRGLCSALCRAAHHSLVSPAWPLRRGGAAPRLMLQHAPLIAAAWLRRGLNAPLLVATVALAAYPLLTASPYALRLMTIAGIYALLVLGYQFIFGHAGALSLAQGTFFGVGGYVTG